MWSCNIWTVMKMKNRDRYILKVNELDLMMKVKDNLAYCDECPIYAIAGQQSFRQRVERCNTYCKQCQECCQDWLNEES